MSIDFRVRDFFYPTRIWRLRREFSQNQWRTESELEQYQFRLLKRTLDHASRRVPYYRGLFRRIGFRPEDLSSLSDIEQLPTLTKETVREQGSRLLAEDADRYRPVLCRTSGSTGEPLSFFLDAPSQTLEFVYYWRLWGWAGYRLGDKFADLSSHFFLVTEGASGLPTVYQPHLRRLLLNGTQLSPEVVREMARALRRHRPRFLKGIANTLYFMALNFREAGIQDVEFDCVFSGGEVLTDLYRKEIEQVFRAPVLDSYGHMERTVAICQCPEKGYHVNSDYGLLEMLPHGSSRSGSRHHRVVGTSLHNLAMPLIRYEVGDTLEIVDEPRYCKCGRRFPLVKGIHGRHEDAVITPDGRAVTALCLVPELVPGTRFVQFIQTRPDSLVLCVVPRPSWGPSAEASLMEYTRRMVGPTVKLEVKLIDLGNLARDRSGKLRAVISEI